MATTTREQWYQQGHPSFYLNRRGDRNVPVRYLKGVQWRNQGGIEGYYVRDANPRGWSAVEFSFERYCWYEVTWDEVLQQWCATGELPRQASIEVHEVVDRGEWGPIDGENRTSTLATPAPSETSAQSESSEGSNSEEEEEEEVEQLNTPIEANTIEAESTFPEEIQIQPPEMTTTITIPTISEGAMGSIDPHTGHRYVSDDINIQ